MDESRIERIKGKLDFASSVVGSATASNTNPLEGFALLSWNQKERLIKSLGMRDNEASSLLDGSGSADSEQSRILTRMGVADRYELARMMGPEGVEQIAWMFSPAELAEMRKAFGSTAGSAASSAARAAYMRAVAEEFHKIAESWSDRIKVTEAMEKKILAALELHGSAFEHALHSMSGEELGLTYLSARTEEQKQAAAYEAFKDVDKYAAGKKFDLVNDEQIAIAHRQESEKASQIAAEMEKVRKEDPKKSAEQAKIQAAARVELSHAIERGNAAKTPKEKIYNKEIIEKTIVNQFKDGALIKDKNQLNSMMEMLATSKDYTLDDFHKMLAKQVAANNLSKDAARELEADFERRKAMLAQESELASKQGDATRSSYGRYEKSRQENTQLTIARAADPRTIVEYESNLSNLRSGGRTLYSEAEVEAAKRVKLAEEQLAIAKARTAQLGEEAQKAQKMAEAALAAARDAEARAAAAAAEKAALAQRQTEQAVQQRLMATAGTQSRVELSQSAAKAGISTQETLALATTIEQKAKAEVDADSARSKANEAIADARKNIESIIGSFPQETRANGLEAVRLALHNPSENGWINALGAETIKNVVAESVRNGSITQAEMDHLMDPPAFPSEPKAGSAEQAPTEPGWAGPEPDKELLERLQAPSPALKELAEKLAAAEAAEKAKMEAIAAAVAVREKIGSNYGEAGPFGGIAQNAELAEAESKMYAAAKASAQLSKEADELKAKMEAAGGAEAAAKAQAEEAKAQAAASEQSKAKAEADQAKSKADEAKAESSKTPEVAAKSELGRKDAEGSGIDHDTAVVMGRMELASSLNARMAEIEKMPMKEQDAQIKKLFSGAAGSAILFEVAKGAFASEDGMGFTQQAVKKELMETLARARLAGAVDESIVKAATASMETTLTPDQMKAKAELSLSGEELLASIGHDTVKRNRSQAVERSGEDWNPKHDYFKPENAQWLESRAASASASVKDEAAATAARMIAIAAVDGKFKEAGPEGATLAQRQSAVAEAVIEKTNELRGEAGLAPASSTKDILGFSGTEVPTGSQFRVGVGASEATPFEVNSLRSSIAGSLAAKSTMDFGASIRAAADSEAQGQGSGQKSTAPWSRENILAAAEPTQEPASAEPAAPAPLSLVAIGERVKLSNEEASRDPQPVAPTASGGLS